MDTVSAARAVETELLPGAQLGDDVTIVSRIRRGGIGDVYSAWSTRLWAPVACKVLRSELVGEPGARWRLMHEGRVLRALTHPRIVRLFDINERADPPYLLLELLEGPTVADVLARDGPLPADVAVRLALHVASALLHAHRRGFLHLDVKPSNVVLMGGYPKLIDFSISRRCSVASPKSRRGTARSMAPEQCLRRPLGPATDVFGLGGLLFQMLANSAAFPDVSYSTNSPLEARYPQILFDATPLESVRPDVPSELTAIVNRCLMRRAADRYQEMLAVMCALAPFAGTSIWPPGIDPRDHLPHLAHSPVAPSFQPERAAL